MKTAILSSHDYEPYGSALPYRGFEGDKYKFGFNSQEKDFDIIEGLYGAEYWEYDSRTGRRWNIDPVTNASISPYACLLDNPICFTDPIGATSVGGYISNFFKKAGEIIKTGWNKLWGAGSGKVGHAGISFSFSKLYMKVAGFLRKTFTHAERALSLVPMGRMKTTETGPINGTGDVDFDIQNINYAMYRFKGIKVSGTFNTPTNASFLIEDRFEHGNKRFIDWFIPFMTPGNNPNGTGTVVAFGGRTGIIPFLNTYLYGRIYNDLFGKQDMEDLALSIALEEINGMFTMPYHKHTSHFRISTSADVQYQFNIKYRAWTRYDNYDPKNSRPFWHKLLYGI